MPPRIHTSPFSTLVVAGLTLITLHSESHAATAMLGASKDNTLFNNPTGASSNGTGPIFAGRTGAQGPGAQRAVVAFDLSGEIPAGAIITDVQVTLNVLQGGNGSGLDSYALHRLQQDWGEGTSNASGGGGANATPGDATWIHTFFDTSTWNNPGGDFESSPSASKTIGVFGSETWGSTPELVADVQGWVDDPSSNFGWILIGNESTFASARQFASRELQDGPLLTVSYIPEPASLALGLLASCATICCTRSRSA